MSLTRRHFSAALLSSGVGGLAFPALAEAPAPVQGTQYTRLTPAVPIQVPANKIEVIEFFSYACPHCSAFEPTLEAWVKTLPPDVMFHRVPVPFLANAEGFARTYYTLETLGKVDAMQLKVFSAVHVDRQRLDKPADVAALAAKNGIDGSKFLDVYNSFSVANSVNKSKKLAEAYKLDGVPTLGVQGRYLTSPSQAGSAEAALATASFLIAEARKG
jgi:thiol:disulfide interchange protein DsbA